MVKRQRVTTGDEVTQEYQVVPGPAEEAEGTVHPAEEPESTPETSFDEVVDQVLRGEWGVGQDRRLRLHNAGYNPNDVQREIVRRANAR